MTKECNAKPVDVLIVGAGINGAGLFRDLCLQGVSTVLIDKGDYGSGTSAAPSRLIHGGIKYLETGELRLVAQSTLERNLLLKNAPHAVKPLPTIIPIFSWFNGVSAALRTLFGSVTAPRSRGALLIEIGLILYDLYGARDRVMPRHRFWTKAKALAEMPFLTPRIVAAGTYHDAMVCVPERLVLELVKDGLATAPQSEAHTYTSLEQSQGDIVTVCHEDGTRQTYRPRILINAAGPWIDRVNGLLGFETKLIGGTKGSHIIIDSPELVAALKGRMVYYEADDGRICLVFDYHGRALVGSTDVFADDPDKVRCEDDEIAYFLESLSGLLPDLKLERSQIVYCYSGIRPLPAADNTEAGLVSRDHSSPRHAPDEMRPYPVISLVGGKWTTFRGFAEEVCNRLLGELGLERQISTRAAPIGGGVNYPQSDHDKANWLKQQRQLHAVSETRAWLLFERYGTTASQIIALEASGYRLINGTRDHSDVEIDWIVRNEGVCHVMDILVRRTLIGVDGSLTINALDDIARICGNALGWSDARIQSEIDDAARQLAERHRVTISSEGSGYAPLG
ncbi:glycerol-3-phosphate dehydrogenase/oxidase [Cohaesibacter intestini]|uniref:glycerol-3-phosphate dehydrogenase/oxidase n=1 Tax=Cohaesibacter intestini TaxID=2211145 RepID=UPI000DEA57A0|nr:glycerol-3-phosphate dehydrogenase/oxidase [Cohaesibacter intestini]